jgi:hypothetical protein
MESLPFSVAIRVQLLSLPGLRFSVALNHVKTHQSFPEVAMVPFDQAQICNLTLLQSALNAYFSKMGFVNK